MISAVVLTHNDQDHIGKTLASLSWCDEIIVIDDESIDTTVEIAKEHKATVYIHGLRDDFAAQRNFGLSKAKNDWVLFVDSDEIVTDGLAQEIEKIVRSAEQTRCSGSYIRRKDFLWGRWLAHGETGRVRLLRLAKKNSGKWVRPVHEVWQVNGPVGELVNPLLHYPHQNVAQFLSEINHYSSLNAKYLHDKGVRVPWWHIIAYPKAKFFLNYVWYLGFLDGTAGVVVALMMSFHSFLTRAKLWQLWDKS